MGYEIKEIPMSSPIESLIIGDDFFIKEYILQVMKMVIQK